MNYPAYAGPFIVPTVALFPCVVWPYLLLHSLSHKNARPRKNKLLLLLCRLPLPYIRKQGTWTRKKDQESLFLVDTLLQHCIMPSLIKKVVISLTEY